MKATLLFIGTISANTVGKSCTKTGDCDTSEVGVNAECCMIGTTDESGKDKSIKLCEHKYWDGKSK